MENYLIIKNKVLVISGTKDFLVNTIDLSSFESGVYFINISTDKGTHIEKIILTK